MGANTFFSDPPTNGNTTFAERLEWLCAGRTIGAWAKRVGMRGASIDAMRGPEGRAPGQEFLTRIMRIENASISWLLGGSTSPFMVARTDSDTETAQLLRDHLEDEAWAVEMVQSYDERTSGLVLHQPAAIVTEKGEDIPYRALQLIAGPIGRHTDQLLPGSMTVHHLTPDAIHAFYAGRLGTWLLFGGEGRPPLLDGGRVYAEANPARPRLRIADAVIGADTPALLSQEWHSLPVQDRDALDRVIHAILKSRS